MWGEGIDRHGVSEVDAESALGYADTSGSSAGSWGLVFG